MKVRAVDIAERLGLSRQTINAYLREGMPDSSIEAAEAWYSEKMTRRTDNSIVPIDGEIVDEDFAKIVEKHRELKALAYDQYLEDLRERSPQQAKSYATYDKLVKTLVSLERELQARQIANRELIKAQTAIDRFGKVILSIRNEISLLPLKVSAKANPDAPGTAMKAIETEVNKMLTRLAGQADDVANEMVEVQIELPKEEITDIPDEIEPDGNTV